MNTIELQNKKKNIRGQLNNKLVAPLIIAGPPGTGKSSTMRRLAKELEMNLIEYSMPSIQIEKLSGLPTEYATPQFNSSIVIDYKKDVYSTVWSIPEIIANCLSSAQHKPTILLLEDFHAMGQHLQSYFYELLLERKLGNYKLPDNVVILGTMNDSDLAGFNGISSAIRNRLAILKVQFNFEHWFANYGNRLHYLVASFLKSKPHYCQENETTGIEGYATARAWTSIAAELSVYEDPIPFAHSVASMQVSTQAAQAFHSHVLYIQTIDFTKLVANQTIVDLSKQDPIDSIIYSYIPNFIHTIKDAMYLFELLETNFKSKTFIGFVMGELYIKYQQSENLSDGLKFIINKLINQPLIQSDYPNTSKAEFDKISTKPINNLDEMMKIAADFLI